MLYKIANVSFPRSGHHALKAVLAEYFGSEFHYCDNYKDATEKRIVNDPETNYQKEHDLRLDFPSNLPGVKYLIQIRDPALSIQSWIDFDARVYCNRNNTRKDWIRAFSSNMDFWNSWFKKWVLAEITPRLVVPYSHLVAMPFGTCESVIQFMTGHHAEPDRLNAALQKFPIAVRPERYSHYMDLAL